MRVLCTTPPMEGAFGPFAALGRALVEAGHDVLVATGPDLQGRARAHGFDALDASLAELAARGERYDVVAAFDVLEHWDTSELVDNFRAVGALPRRTR